MNIRKLARKAKALMNFPGRYDAEADLLKFMQGQNLAALQKLREIKNIREAEFKVYSQWGEDGIIQWLSAKLPPPLYVVLSNLV